MANMRLGFVLTRLKDAGSKLKYGHTWRMPLTPGERISLILESATLLDKNEWNVIDLILQQHGIAISDDWHEGKSGYVQAMIQREPDERLQQLHGYLTNDVAGGESPPNGPWSGTRLRLFCSHLAIERTHIGEVGASLSRFGIEPFIAHDSIDPSREWAQVIEGALYSCDALVAFMHNGFFESVWCGQEVGWILGRKRPVLPLSYGQKPIGFMEKYQYQACQGLPPQRIALSIVDWLSKTPSVHARFATGIVGAFAESKSWDFTRTLAPFLERITSVSDDDLGRMELAAHENVNVRECMVARTVRGPEWVRDYVNVRRGQASVSGIAKI
jgi:hypothetical protein